jgi:hypothetical protein
MEDCLLRRLIHDVWLRKNPAERTDIVESFIRKVSTYDPATGMIVAFLSASGAADFRHVTFTEREQQPSTAVA